MNYSIALFSILLSDSMDKCFRIIETDQVEKNNNKKQCFQIVKFVVGSVALFFFCGKTFSLETLFKSNTPKTIPSKPGFHIIVSDVTIVSVAEFFVKPSGRLYPTLLQ